MRLFIRGNSPSHPAPNGGPADSRPLQRRPLLSRKVWRDTLSLLVQAPSLSLLILLGIFLYIGLHESYQNLTVVYGRIYGATRFADASVQFESGPASLAARARTLPHVRHAIGRIVKDGAIIQTGRPRGRVLGRFIALPPGKQPPINALWMTQGRFIAGSDEAVLEDQFANTHGYKLGDRVRCSYRGREREFVLVGFATSPEYLYAVPSRHETFVSRGTFGVLWVEEERAREWFGSGRQINEIHCHVTPGHGREVADKLAGMTHSYGTDWAFTQDEQPSKRLLTLDQQGFARLSFFFPVLFMIAAALSLYGALSRIVRLQVTVIGTLRACGFSQREIGRHYLAQGGLVTVFGAVPGLFLGHWLAVWLNRLYVRELYLPVASAEPHWDTILTGLLAAIATGLAAAYLPARMAAHLPPAMAMRGETNTGARVRAQQTLVRWTRFLAIAYRIPIRGIFRRASRTVFAVAGIAGGVSILLTTFGMHVSTMDAINEYLLESRRYQIDLQFMHPAANPLVGAAAQLPGGRAGSLTVSLPVRISSPVATRELVLTGLQRGQSLLHVRTVGREAMRLQAGTVWLPRRVAEGLRVDPGDPVSVEWVRSSRRRPLRTTLRVAGLLDVAMGNSGYAEYHDVRRALADRAWPLSGYGAHFDCDPGMAETFRRLFERSDDVALVTTTQDAAREIREQLALMFIFLGVLLSFGTLLAGSAIHSVASVSLIERTRELASLRSLGFSAGSAGWLAGLELFALAVMGLIVGIPLGTRLNEFFASAYTTDNMQFRAYLPLWVHATATAIVFGLVLLSVWLGVRRLRGMDLAQATKARE